LLLLLPSQQVLPTFWLLWLVLIDVCLRAGQLLLLLLHDSRAGVPPVPP
jgi:hypothetical protein